MADLDTLHRANHAAPQHPRRWPSLSEVNHYSSKPNLGFYSPSACAVAKRLLKSSAPFLLHYATRHTRRRPLTRPLPNTISSFFR
jgi:hypothetical protein